MAKMAAPTGANPTTTDQKLNALETTMGQSSKNFGNGPVRLLTTLPPPFSKPSLKPATDSSPAAYFQVMVIAVFLPCLAATSPMA